MQLKLHELQLKEALTGLSLILLILSSLSAISPAAAQVSSASGSTIAASVQYPPYPVNLYVFYRTDCPHCQALAPHIAALAAEYPTLHVYQYETQNDANFSLFETFESAYRMKLLDTVPTVFVGKQSFVSDSAEPQIEAAVAQAIQSGATGPGDTIAGHAMPAPAAPPTPTALPSVLLVPPSDLPFVAAVQGVALAICLILVVVIVARKSH